MSDAKESWDNVSAKASSLGLKLKLHLAQARGAEEGPAGATDAGPATEAAEGAAATEAESKEARDVKDAFRRLADAIDDAFGAVGNAAKDPAVKEDVKAMGQALVEALGTTFSQVGDEVRKVVHRKGDKAGEGPDSGGPGAGPSSS